MAAAAGLGLLRERVIPGGNLQHLALRSGVRELLSQRPRLLRALSPVCVVIAQSRHRENIGQGDLLCDPPFPQGSV
jgi:hypothetical protein